MIPFKTVTLCDKGWVDEIVRAENSPSADYNFGNIYIWDKRYRQLIARLGDRMLTKLRYEGHPAFVFPIGSGPLRPAIEALRDFAAQRGYPLVIRGITDGHRAMLEQEYPGCFEFCLEENNLDYLYRAEKLATYAGKSLHGKKNHCNRFEAEHDWDFVPLTRELIPGCLDMLDVWTEDNFQRLDKSVVYEHDPAGMKKRINNFLDICSRHGIRPLIVFLDECWAQESHYGKQPAPKPGIHNSGWVRDPSRSLRKDTITLYRNLSKYVKDIISSHRNDKRVLAWDLYNEPSPESLWLLKKVFEWAREVDPSQPLTSGIWTTDLKDLNRAQLDLSDVSSYHGYGPALVHRAAHDTLSLLGRPIFCTEYMARKFGGTFQDNLPVMRELNISAINWGFVAGKTNTNFAWDDVRPDGKEPELWFHDIIRQDGTPFSQEEVDTIRSLTGKLK